MTAINILCRKQRDAIYLLTDGAHYTNDGIFVGNSTKVFLEPHWPGIITGRGVAIAVPILGTALSVRFATFDALVENIEAALPGMVEYYGIKKDAELVIAGFSKIRGAPEAYLINTTDTIPDGMTPAAVETAKADGSLPEKFKLQRLDDNVCSPAPTIAAVQGATELGHMVGFDLASDDPKIIESSLIQLVDTQRHSIYEDGLCWVGGNALLTILRGSGDVEQRIVKRWPDVIGEVMDPKRATSNVVPLRAAR